MYGPFSIKAPKREEQPGPPENQKLKVLLLGF